MTAATQPTQQANAASSTRQTATTWPALMPHPAPDAPHGIYWATHAVNEDAMAEIMGIDLDRRTEKPMHGALAITLCTAECHMKREAALSFRNARDAGGLLFAWRGSRALVQALPASLNGGAA